MLILMFGDVNILSIQTLASETESNWLKTLQLEVHYQQHLLSEKQARVYDVG